MIWQAVGNDCNVTCHFGQCCEGAHFDRRQTLSHLLRLDSLRKQVLSAPVAAAAAATTNEGVSGMPPPCVQPPSNVCSCGSESFQSAFGMAARAAVQTTQPCAGGKGTMWVANFNGDPIIEFCVGGASSFPLWWSMVSGGISFGFNVKQVDLTCPDFNEFVLPDNCVCRVN